MEQHLSLMTAQEKERDGGFDVGLIIKLGIAKVCWAQRVAFQRLSG